MCSPQYRVPGIAEQVLFGAGRGVPAEPARAVGVVVTVGLRHRFIARRVPGRLIREYSGMSIVISTSAITPVRHLRAISAFAEVGPRRQHGVDDVAGDEEGGVGDLVRGDDRDPSRRRTSV